MEVIRSAAEMRAWSEQVRCGGAELCLVPTMGSLHEGHLSLAREARRRADVVAVSIYVNPTQFGPGGDYERYPRDEKRDLELLRELGVDCAFIPKSMYPPGDSTFIEVRSKLTEVLCGSRRPGHFAGVARVVAKLFIIVAPHRAVFGLKDYQQLLVVRRLVRDLHLGVEIVAAPIVRDADGLALSSRNRYLTPEQRRQAPALHSALRAVEAAWKAGEDSVHNLVSLGHRTLKEQAPDGRLEYLELRHPATLEGLEFVGWDGALAALAVRFGDTRLIDNILLQHERDA
ncbi:MAG: pantoate--beta-alanine ligase [Candidatus Coatesbacteria bacterium]|nr:pantoate--beta-alanine ligase [Candidatus Coatesbacteria bacterium]